jgi:hypothetical protein
MRKRGVRLVMNQKYAAEVRRRSGGVIIARSLKE